MKKNLKNYKELGIGHIRIGVSTSLCKHILLDYLKDFIKENPNIKFSIDCHSTVNTIKLLRNEDIDIGLICNTELPKGIVYSPVKEIHDVFVASPEYLDNFYERANGRDQYSFADELSGNIKGNIIPLLNSGLASATHGDATDQGADKKAEITDIHPASLLLPLFITQATQVCPIYQQSTSLKAPTSWFWRRQM